MMPHDHSLFTMLLLLTEPVNVLASEILFENKIFYLRWTIDARFHFSRNLITQMPPGSATVHRIAIEGKSYKKKKAMLREIK